MSRVPRRHGLRAGSREDSRSSHRRRDVRPTGSGPNIRARGAPPQPRHCRMPLPHRRHPQRRRTRSSCMPVKRWHLRGTRSRTAPHRCHQPRASAINECIDTAGDKASRLCVDVRCVAHRRAASLPAPACRCANQRRIDRSATRTSCTRNVAAAGSSSPPTCASALLLRSTPTQSTSRSDDRRTNSASGDQVVSAEREHAALLAVMDALTDQCHPARGRASIRCGRTPPAGSCPISHIEIAGCPANAPSMFVDPAHAHLEHQLVRVEVPRAARLRDRIRHRAHAAAPRVHIDRVCRQHHALTERLDEQHRNHLQRELGRNPEKVLEIAQSCRLDARRRRHECVPEQMRAHGAMTRRS